MPFGRHPRSETCARLLAPPRRTAMPATANICDGLENALRTRHSAAHSEGSSMTIQALLTELAQYMPSAHVQYDSDGRVVICTGMVVDARGELREEQTEEV